jgi:predicted  nucleic acid-binding Zn-ribbon protein
MAHKCVRCGSSYEDNDSTILRGCKSCGSIFFLYLKSAEDAQEIKKIENELEAHDTTLEKELEKTIGEKKSEITLPIVEEQKIEVAKEVEKHVQVQKDKFGIETVKMPKEGVYEINLEALMGKKPLIILEKGRVYFIHLPTAFEKVK